MSAGEKSLPLEGKVAPQASDEVASPERGGGASAPEGSSPPPNPCTRDCPKRHPHCHGDCEPYLAYYAWRRAVNEKSHRKKELDAMRLEGINKAVRYARVMRGKLH